MKNFKTFSGRWPFQYLCNCTALGAIWSGRIGSQFNTICRYFFLVGGGRVTLKNCRKKSLDSIVYTLPLSDLGDVLTVAEVAGVMAAKRSADLLPHRLTPPITKVCCRQYILPPSGTAPLTNGSGSGSCPIFVLDLQDANKKLFFLSFLLFTVLF